MAKALRSAKCDKETLRILINFGAELPLDPEVKKVTINRLIFQG